MKSSEDVRKLRDEFRKQNNHQEVKPASLIPSSQDKTVIFNTSGMQQLVPYLTGKDHPLGKRLFNIQPCVRTNDIDDIGDERHLSCFEMMGNRSLGDYFKEESLQRSFEFLTQKVGIPLEKLGATVFGGVPDGSQDIPFDQEAKEILLSLGLPESRIKPIPLINGESDNFRGPPGAVGPCGPCCEIYFDRGDDYGPADRNMSINDRYTEIRNNVFMEFYKDSEENAVKEYIGRLRSHFLKNFYNQLKYIYSTHKNFDLIKHKFKDLLKFEDENWNKLNWVSFEVKEKIIEIEIEDFAILKIYAEKSLQNEDFNEIKDFFKNSPNSSFKLISSVVYDDSLERIINNTVSINESMSAFSHIKAKFIKLAQKNVDTGMGLERFMMVLQGKETIFETDLFEEFLRKLEEISGQKYPPFYKKEKEFSIKEKELTKNFRVITDHFRTSVFLICSWVISSNEGRGYILRRIIRRMRYHFKKINENLITWKHPQSEISNYIKDLVEIVRKKFEKSYEIINQHLTRQIGFPILKEVSQFDETLKKWEKKLEEFREQNKKWLTWPNLLKDNTYFWPTWPQAFILSDTYGYPVELTKEIILNEYGKLPQNFDEEYSKSLEKAKETSRKSASGMFKKGIDRAKHIEGVEPTQFTGYTHLEEDDITILKELDLDGQKVLILDKSPFYAEGGGQTGDNGIIETNDGRRFDVVDVQKYAGVRLHFVK